MGFQELWRHRKIKILSAFFSETSAQLLLQNFHILNLETPKSLSSFLIGRVPWAHWGLAPVLVPVLLERRIWL